MGGKEKRIDKSQSLWIYLGRNFILFLYKKQLKFTFYGFYDYLISSKALNDKIKVYNFDAKNYNYLIISV